MCIRDRAQEVVVTPYKTTILADGKDATVLNITVLDREGREVPDADNLISFNIEGDGKIIGVGNGDPSSHEPDKCDEGAWQRHLFNGKCQVIIQSGLKPVSYTHLDVYKRQLQILLKILIIHSVPYFQNQVLLPVRPSIPALMTVSGEN